MKFEIILSIVEYPATGVANPSGDLLNRLIGDEVQVEFRTNRGDHVGQQYPVILRLDIV